MVQPRCAWQHRVGILDCPSEVSFFLIPGWKSHPPGIWGRGSAICALQEMEGFLPGEIQSPFPGTQHALPPHRETAVPSHGRHWQEVWGVCFYTSFHWANSKDDTLQAKDCLSAPPLTVSLDFRTPASITEECVETRVTTEEMRRRSEERHEWKSCVFCFWREGAPIGKRGGTEARMHVLKCRVLRVFSPKWCFVNLSSVHLHAFYDVPWRWRVGGGSQIFPFSNLPFENIKAILSKLDNKGF